MGAKLCWPHRQVIPVDLSDTGRDLEAADAGGPLRASNPCMGNPKSRDGSKLSEV